MATYILTVDGFVRHAGGVRIRPGVPASAFDERPALDQLIQGAVLELRRPDGWRRRTRLLTYGIEAWRGSDDQVYIDGPPTLQPIVLTLPSEVEDSDLAIGTQVWYVEEQPAQQLRDKDGAVEQ